MKVLRAILVGALCVMTVDGDVHAMMSPDGAAVPMKDFDQASALVEEKRYGEAVEALSALLRDAPRHADAWNLLGFSQRMSGNLDAAEQAYDNALSITPTHPGALNYKGQMYVQTGRMEQAREMLAKLQVACGDCKEHRQLAEAIRDGRAGNY